MNKLALLTGVLVLLLLPAPSRASEGEILLDYIPAGRITRFEEPVQFWIGGKDRLEGQYYVDTVMNEMRLAPCANSKSGTEVATPDRSSKALTSRLLCKNAPRPMFSCHSRYAAIIGLKMVVSKNRPGMDSTSASLRIMPYSAKDRAMDKASQGKWP